MSLEEYTYAIIYAQETYIRRDIVYIMSKIYGKKKGGGTTIFTFKHPGIEEFIRKSYKKVKEGTVI